MQFSGVSRFLPSKRIGALVVVVAALITSTLIIRADTTPTPKGPVARLTTEQQNFNETDTDGDGVKDWEEALWGFSAVSPDTDGDSVGDAQEISEQQQRLEIERTSLISEAGGIQNGASYEGISETEKISRGILEQVVAFQSAGISLDGDTTNDIAHVLGSVIQTPSASVIAVDASDMTTVPETSASLTTYANALGTILGGKATAETNEMLALAQFGQTGDTGALDSLTSVVATYDGIIRSLTNTAVPESLLNAHVALINGFSNTKQSVALLAKIGSDPIQGIQGLQTYSASSQSVATAFENIRTYLRSRITLDTGAPGHIIIETTSQ